jgi:hypothetical protein
MWTHALSRSCESAECRPDSSVHPCPCFALHALLFPALTHPACPPKLLPRALSPCLQLNRDVSSVNCPSQSNNEDRICVGLARLSDMMMTHELIVCCYRLGFRSHLLRDIAPLVLKIKASRWVSRGLAGELVGGLVVLLCASSVNVCECNCVHVV